MSLCFFFDSTDEPLLLTPLIDEGKIRMAVKKSEVTKIFKGVKAYSGYITVDKPTNKSHLFFLHMTKGVRIF